MDVRNLDRLDTQTDLIDGHVHLSEIEHPERAVENAVRAGVKRMVAVAMNLDSCRNCNEKCGKVFWIIKCANIKAGFLDQGVYRTASSCSR